MTGGRHGTGGDGTGDHGAGDHGPGQADPDGAKAAEPSCPSCGETVYPGEIFCEKCGHRLTPPAPVETAEPAEPAGAGAAPVPAGAGAPAGDPCRGCGGAPIDAEGYCEICGMRQPAERDHVEVELPAPGGGNGSGPVAAAGASDRGRRYSRNEDALALAAHAAGVAAVVCDGVGSSQRPEDASRTAADTGAAELVALLDAGEDPEDATRAAALRAASAVAALSTSPGDAPSCTYVSAVTRGASVTVGWVGDSRAYWLSADGAVDPGEGGAAEPATDESGPETAELSTGDMAEIGPSRRLTEDDSWAAFMTAQGALTEAEAEQHPNAHVITAWLGADAGQVSPHVATFRPAGPGTLLVCSDGLWNYFPAARDLAALLAAGPGAPGPAAGHDPAAANTPGAANGAGGTAPGSAPDPGHDPAADPLGVARALVRRALDAGGRDNITVAVIPIPSPRSPHSRIHESIPHSTEPR
ncbi:protein phosphatase 2C domain-containing protein [Actinomadura sp. 6K520]|uniref:protein phosphatase 2C domain-containing protein n=1 Tax=Actinomadura sp. 6K520 TaxID=2530364 RepID=UPI00104A5162|nr:protein phosphatase 2C domain-containing protein [Actinomadura sp. 6K520]TDE25098.1 zinc-ribbon domain-containing protein [Actinomadura sp. 6K520]